MYTEKFSCYQNSPFGTSEGTITKANRMPFSHRYTFSDVYILEELRRSYQNSDAKGRIELLKKLYSKFGNHRGGHAPFEIALLAVEDPNADVRQWIARHGECLNYRGTAQEEILLCDASGVPVAIPCRNLEERLKKDPDPFVRASLRENPTVFGSLFFEKWMDYFREANHMERLALVRNPKIVDSFIEKVFDPEDNELNITLQERQELAFAFFANEEALATAARFALSEPTCDELIISHFGSRHFLQKLWHLASKWPTETKMQITIYLLVPADDKTKAEVYRTCDEPAYRHAILENCGGEDIETIELGIKDIDEVSRWMAEDIKKQVLKTQIPDNAKELFKRDGFLEPKINFIGRQLLDIEHYFTTDKALRNAIVLFVIIYFGQLLGQLLVWFFRQG